MKRTWNFWLLVKIRYLILSVYKKYKSKKASNEDKYAFIMYFSRYKDFENTLYEIGYVQNTGFITYMENQYRKQFNLFNNNLEKKVWLYLQAPDFIIADRNQKLIFQDLKDILGNWVTDGKSILGSGIDTEKAVLNILSGLFRKIFIEDEFLELLLEPFKGKVTILEQLFYKVDNKFGDKNFTKLVKFLYKIWSNSSFVEENHKAFKETDGPPSLPYRTDKFLGFHSSNTDLEFNNKIIDVTAGTGAFIKKKVPVGRGVYSTIEKEITADYKYHIFQPILLTEFNTKSELSFPRGKIPAFYLLANENLEFWSNVVTSIEYSIDILTTFSGVGNISKFRHLAKVAKVAARLNKGKVVTFANTLSTIKLVAGLVEIASGTINVLIRLSGVDSDFSRAVQKYLFYLELVTLAGELKGAVKQKIRKNLKKHAREALSKEKSIKKLKQKAETIDELLDINDSIKFLEKVAEVSKKIKNSKNVKLYRVQGGNKLPKYSRFRFFYKNKELLIKGNNRLYVTFKDEKRVIEFWINRGEKAEIFTASINKSFFEKLFNDAVPQNLGKAFPNKPQFGDFSKTNFSLGIPKNYFEELISNINNIEIIKFE
jgi:hypothetical protein